VSTDSKTLSKQQFTPDFEVGTLTCPDGLLADRKTLVQVSGHDVLVPRFAWVAATCADCPLRVACVGESNRGRGVVLHPYERELRSRLRSAATGKRRTLLDAAVKHFVNGDVRDHGTPLADHGVDAGRIWRSLTPATTIP